MNIRIRVGNLFDSSCQTLVNTVNTVGIMGKGIALEFKKRFPQMHEDYVRRCALGLVELGQPYLWSSVIPPAVLNFPTKEHWRSVSRLSNIVAGLEHLQANYREWGITSIAVPPLGCGQGGLDWRIVGPTLYRYLSALDIPVELYAPHGTPAEELEEAFLAGGDPAHIALSAPTPMKVSASSIALAEILARIVAEKHHWPVGRTSFQKLAYFATEVGLPTDLEYDRGSYGPFSSEVKPLITKLVNNGVIREERLGSMFAVLPGPTYDDARGAFSEELKDWDPLIDRVSELMQRFRTTNQAEIAATVHFVARSLAHRPSRRPTESEVLDEVMRWKKRRKPPLKEEDVALAIRALGALGWIHIEASEELPVPDDELLGV